MKPFPLFISFVLALNISLRMSRGDEASDLISRSEASGAKVVKEASDLIDALKDNAKQESASGAQMIDSLTRGSTSKQGSAPSHVKSMPSSSAQKLPTQQIAKDIPLVDTGKKTCGRSASSSESKCPSSLLGILQNIENKGGLNPSSNTQLLIFVSQSMPKNSIKELWGQAQGVGGKLLFRGLVGGSFKETQNYIQELGIVADIDPTKFEEFEVTFVPAFILSKGDKHDKMVGNISLNEFLEQSSISGDLKEEATVLYKKLERNDQ